MRTFLLIPVVVILCLAVLWVIVWGALALHFRMPGPEPLRWAAIAVFVLFGLATLRYLFDWRRWRWLAAFASLTAILLVWWNTLEPPADGDWALGVERQTTGVIEGDILTLTDIRDFDWQTATEATATWTNGTYDLSTIQTVDLFMSYWAGPAMAHLMVSFGFEDGRYLAWSGEVRREAESQFSPVADFFKEHSLVMLAAEERDVIGLRSNIKNETVYIFRLGATPEQARNMLEAYVVKADKLAEEPVFFNSVFTNCSYTVLQMVRAIGVTLPVDWRVLVNGYLPNYLHELGSVNTSVSLDELYSAGDITARALAEGLTPDYSAAIRDGVPEGPIP